MIHSKHFSHEELQALLDDELSVDNRIEEHLNECESCRSALDEMAAHSEMWQKAPRLLQPKLNADNIQNLGSRELETTERPIDSNSAPAYEFGYPIESLLEAPRHPEMMGRIGRYDIEREIGRGGMGIVFKAHDSELNRPLAIKVLSPHLANHGPARERFAQEARAAAAVLHPNVIAVHDVGTDGKTPYIVMPFVAGHSLQKLVEDNGPFAEIDIVRIALQIAAGLTPAHSQGLVHRDIKPANMLMERSVNRVIITDFGLARAEDDASLTKTGWLTGTPNYMSPEQTRGARLDHRSDLFSLGSLIYFLATGRLPFRSESALGVLNRIQNDQPTPVREVNRNISRTLANIVAVLLRKDPAGRFQSAAELHDVLEQHLAHLHQPTISKPPKIGKSIAPKRAVRMFLSTATVLAVGLGLYLAIGALGAIGNNNDGSNSMIESGVWSDSDGSRFLVAANAKQKPKFDSEFYSVLSGVPEDRKGERAFRKGFSYFESGKYEAAIEQFEIACQDPVYEKPATYNVGCAWAALGDKDKAFEYLNRAIDIGFIGMEQYEDDDDIASLRDDKRFETLLTRLEKANESIELISKGKGHLNREEYVQAIKSFRKALELAPDNSQAQLNLGYSLHMLGQYEEAMKWHRAAAESKDEAALGNYNAACVYALEGDVDNAINYLNRAFDAGLDRHLNSQYLEDDSDLDNLRDDPRFKSITKELKVWNHQKSGSHFNVAQGYEDFVELKDVDWIQLNQMDGKWSCRVMGEKVRMTLNFGSDTGKIRWGYTADFDKSDFEPKLENGGNEFRLERDFGTLVFDGSVNNRSGKGLFRFQDNERYESWLAGNGLKEIPAVTVFQLFMPWQDEQRIVENLKELQSLDLDEPTLKVLMIHGVDASLVEEYQDRGLDPAEYKLFVVWRVSPGLIESYLEANLDLDEHKKFINARVKPKLIEQYHEEGIDVMEHEQFVTARISPRLIKRYTQAGLSIKDNKEFINQQIDPDLLTKYVGAGFDVDEFANFIEHRVQPSELISYRNAGLDPKKYIRFVRKRIPSKLVLSYERSGLNLRRLDGLLQARVKADDIVSYQEAGLFENQNWRFLRNRVPAGLLEKYRENGLDLIEYDRYILQRMQPEKAMKAHEARQTPDATD